VTSGTKPYFGGWRAGEVACENSETPFCFERTLALPMRFILYCIFALSLSAPIHADVIFSNLTTPAQEGGINICGASAVFCDGSQAVAAAFTPPSGYAMTEAQVETFAFGSDVSYTFDAFLYSGSGSAPGTEIAELASNLTAPTSGGPNVIDLGTPIDLSSGVEYWLVLAPAESDSFVAWDLGGSSNVPVAVSLNGGAFAVNPAANLQFEIDGTPLSSVPEPRAAWLLAAALGSAAIRFRKHRVQ
jgi:hypothetical protein